MKVLSAVTERPLSAQMTTHFLPHLSNITPPPKLRASTALMTQGAYLQAVVLHFLKVETLSLPKPW